MASHFPDSGQIFEGRYLIEAQVGSGGFARIYHAIQRDLDRDVALKILKPKPFEDLDAERREMYQSQLVKRFRREARNVAQLRDPHTITLYDYGQTAGGLFYMVFEYIDGETLKFAAENSQPLRPGRVVDILTKTLTSLDEAHALGMLHRDIKPANIMLYEYVGRPDQVKVLDFGISKAVLQDANVTLQNLTRDDMMMGTPRYMSPEQLRGDDIGPPSDIYSLGLVAYELLSGRQAIEEDSTVQIINRQISREPITLDDSAGVSRNLRATINRMLAKAPEDRFQHPRALSDALAGWAADYEFEWTDEWVGPAVESPSDLDDTQVDGWSPEMMAQQSGRTQGKGNYSTRPMGSDFQFEGTTRESTYRPSEAGGSPSGDPESSDNTRAILAFTLGLALASAAAALYVLYLPGESAGGAGADARRADREASRGEPGGRADEEAEASDFEIGTKPPGAEIRVNGRLVGRSPVELVGGHVSYPAVIHAELDDGRRLAQKVERPRERITLDFSVVAKPKSGDDEREPGEKAVGSGESDERAGGESRGGTQSPGGGGARPGDSDRRDRPSADEETAEGGSDQKKEPAQKPDAGAEFPALDM